MKWYVVIYTVFHGSACPLVTEWVVSAEYASSGSAVMGRSAVCQFEKVGTSQCGPHFVQSEGDVSDNCKWEDSGAEPPADHTAGSLVADWSMTELFESLKISNFGLSPDFVGVWYSLNLCDYTLSMHSHIDSISLSLFPSLQSLHSLLWIWLYVPSLCPLSFLF